MNLSDLLNMLPANVRKRIEDNGFIEIVFRNANQRFESFEKMFIKNVSQSEENNILSNIEIGKLFDGVKEIINVFNGEGDILNKVVDKAISKNEFLNKSVDLLKNLTNFENISIDKCIKAIGDVKQLENISLVLNGVSLCETYAGFAIMYAKLDDMSDQINRLVIDEKKRNGIQANFEYKKVLSEHANMLDCRKTRKYYTEEQMRKLVDDEYNVLDFLIGHLTNSLVNNMDDLIYSIVSLASMLSVSIRYFDEIYYFNNKEAIGNGDVWHSSHDSWMKIFDKIADERIVKTIQDHCVFDMKLSMMETDAYYYSMFGSIKDMVIDIENHQNLILALDDEEALAAYYEYVNKHVSDSIHKIFDNAEEIKTNPERDKAYLEAMKQVGLAI